MVKRTDECVCVVVVVFVSRHKEHTVGGPSPAESSHHRTCEYFLLHEALAAYLPPAPASLYDRVTLSLPLDMPTLLRCMYERTTWDASTLSHSRCYEAKLRNCTFSWSFLGSFVSLGRSLLQGVQAEIRLLQEEVKETGKKRLACFYFIFRRRVRGWGGLFSPWQTRVDLVKILWHPCFCWLEAHFVLKRID